MASNFKAWQYTGGWSIVRDKLYHVRDGFPTKEAAEEWLANVPVEELDKLERKKRRGK